MSDTKTITLIEPLMWHAKPVTELTFKPPSGGAYLKLGEPRTLVRTAEGAGYLVEQTSVIEAYLNYCLDHEGGADLLGLMNLADTKRCKDVIFGFFTDADEAISKLKSRRSPSA